MSEEPNRTIGSRNDHRALAEVYGRALAATIAAGQKPSAALDMAKIAVKEFAALLRETA